MVNGSLLYIFMMKAVQTLDWHTSTYNPTINHAEGYQNTKMSIHTLGIPCCDY